MAAGKFSAARGTAGLHLGLDSPASRIYPRAARRAACLRAVLQVDPDKAFAVSIQHDETVVQGPVAYMQCALLYTSSSGERRIRCGPRALPGVVQRACGLSYISSWVSPTCPAQICHVVLWCGMH